MDIKERVGTSGIVGIVGAAIAIVGIVMPWVAIGSGGGAFSLNGLDLLLSDMGRGLKSGITAYIGVASLGLACLSILLSIAIRGKIRTYGMMISAVTIILSPVIFLGALQQKLASTPGFVEGTITEVLGSGFFITIAGGTIILIAALLSEMKTLEPEKMGGEEEEEHYSPMGDMWESMK